jgi:DNA-directed RNA polymerase subunit RPC12/RpoP
MAKTDEVDALHTLKDRLHARERTYTWLVCDCVNCGAVDGLIIDAEGYSCNQCGFHGEDVVLLARRVKSGDKRLMLNMEAVLS